MAGTWRSRFRSIRTRIVVGYVVLLAIALVVTAVITRGALLTRFDNEIDTSLAAEIDQFQQVVDDGDPITGDPFTDLEGLFDYHLRRVLPGDDAAFFALVDGDPFRLSFDAPTDLFAVPELVDSWRGIESTRFETVDTERGRARVLILPVLLGEQSGTFVAASFTQGARAELDDVFRTYAVVALAVLAISAVFALSLASRVVRPIRELTDVTRSVTDADLSARIPVDGHDEVAELAGTFNGMMARLEGGFEHQRQFLDDVAHELRTPITIIQGHLDVLGDDPGETESTVALVSDELARMNRYVNELLLLAQAERPDFLHLTSVDLDLFVSALHRNASQLADRRWVIDQQPVGVAEFDEQRIAQALLNLADNAARHTQPGDEIGIGVSLEPSSLRCWVRDAGTGLEPEVAEDVFSLHVVGELSRSLGGSGLGLPIVAAIAHAHGGEVSVESSAGAGATFTIEIPLPVVAHHAGVKIDDLSKGRS